jgi:hypothetical protein
MLKIFLKCSAVKDESENNMHLFGYEWGLHFFLQLGKWT